MLAKKLIIFLTISFKYVNIYTIYNSVENSVVLGINTRLHLKQEKKIYEHKV